ncbi:hypothetical protein O3P69_020959 [Scylla paramamosain]|uniref:Uncharacterized protein n=1 Tax=Scylla paramamosain TaxID=85552 RepID=A0AAW0SEL5_SCYPA
MVSTLDSESNNPSSSLRGTSRFLVSFVAVLCVVGAAIALYVPDAQELGFFRNGGESGNADDGGTGGSGGIGDIGEYGIGGSGGSGGSGENGSGGSGGIGENGSGGSGGILVVSAISSCHACYHFPLCLSPTSFVLSLVHTGGLISPSDSL